MWTKLQEFWSKLPHKVQAGIIAFGTAALTVLGEEVQALASGQQNFTWPTIKHDLVSAVVAGIIAVRAFYMVPAGSK